MTNRPLYIRKYHSSRLKEYAWQIENTFAESKALGEITAVSDNQILRTIRAVTHRTLNRKKLEVRIATKQHYEKQLTYIQSPAAQRHRQQMLEKLSCCQNDTPCIRRLKEKYIHISVNLSEAARIGEKIERTLFHPDYVTVIMDHPSHYDYLFHHGFTINGKLYRRLSCSAGQARVSTVVFANADYLPEIKRRLENGRDITKKFSPNKFNAYFGLAGSATTIVSEPRFIVVRDFINTTSFRANYVIENGWNVDDTVVPRTLTDVPMNRTDGMGLISYRQAEKWAAELGLDYVPSQFCIRQNFIKGMLCVFPIHEFCEEVNGGNYIVDTIYKDASGSYIKADLRDYDVILTESQFKLWDSFDSLDTYIENCHQNGLHWGISLYTPKEPKHILKLNYQFIQTLRLSQSDVEELASQFVEWIEGVSYDNVYYMLLFLLGVNNDSAKIRQFLQDSNFYWIKALIADHNVKNDKYIRGKIRTLLKHKIEQACKGDIYVDGNFQVIVSDPYGFMQHVCGLPVTGLLAPGKSYSHFWNTRHITQVDAMRSPLTYLSEHVILQLQQDSQTEKWFRYCTQGIILNYHGHETFNFAGSDFDYDILATTSNPVMIRSTYTNELPVVYTPPKPQKIQFTEEDLYRSDCFAFGSIIGSITNKSSNAYALLPALEKQYGTDSPQYRLVKSRLQQCCKAQSCQIDKAKIGRAVKGIPKTWITYNKIKTNRQGKPQGKHLSRKQLYNSALLTRYPYFFRYIYKATDKEYKSYRDSYDVTCRQRFRLSFTQLEALPEKTEEQVSFIENFYRYCPVLLSDSPMNLLCRYIENVQYSISKRTKIQTDAAVYTLYKSDFPYQDDYTSVVTAYKQFLKEKQVTVLAAISDFEAADADGNNQASVQYQTLSDSLYQRLARINSNPYVIVNILVDYLYKEKPTANKELLWSVYGRYIYQNIIKNANVTSALFPFPKEGGTLTYLGYEYELQEVPL